MTSSGLLALSILVAHSAALLNLELRRSPSGLETNASDGRFHAAPPRIKVVYLNDDRAKLKDRCMQSQMTVLVQEAGKLGLSLSTERHSAVVFKNCTDEASCSEEHPECFADGRRYGYVEQDKIRQVSGHFCTHMTVLEKLKAESRDYDHFLILEDDILFLPGFLLKLTNFLKLPAHWDVVALDTYRDGLEQDRVPNDLGLEIFSLSGQQTQYAGAHAWLVNAVRVERLWGLFQNAPVVPNDVALRLPRPLHLGAWAFATGTIRHKPDFLKENESKMTWACRAWVDPEANESPQAIFAERKAILATTSTLDQPDTPSGWPSNVVWEVSHASDSSGDNRTTPRELIVFGMYSSGTKMLSDLIQKNLEEPNGVELCRNYTARGYCGKVWKHLHPRRFQDFEKLRPVGSEPLAETIAVVIVRHPFSVIRSLVRHSYDMSCAGGKVNHTADVGRPASMALQPCTYWEPDPQFMAKTQPAMSRVPNATCEREDGQTLDGGKVCWKSLPEAWNSYAAGYEALASQDYFHETVVLRYEDVVEFPEAAVRRVAHAVGLSEPDHIENVEKMLGRKGWGFAGRTESLERLKLADYNTTFSCEETREICRRLDPALMYKLGYHGCQSTWPGWQQLNMEGTGADVKRLAEVLKKQDVTEEFGVWC